MNSQLAASVFTEELYRIDKKTFVVTTEPWDAVAESEKLLLQKILQAVGLSLEAVVITHQPALDVSVIQSRAARIIYFGAAVSGVNPFEPTTIDGVPAIVSLPLNQLQTDAASKQKLWTGLKGLFNR